MSVEFKDMDFTINNLLYDLTSGKYIPIPPKKKKKKKKIVANTFFLKLKKKNSCGKYGSPCPNQADSQPN